MFLSHCHVNLWEPEIYSDYHVIHWVSCYPWSVLVIRWMFVMSSDCHVILGVPVFSSVAKFSQLLDSHYETGNVTFLKMP
jgi:hypothetical protein